MDGGPEILERGHVFFFYRPNLEEESPRELQDVQRLFIVLKTQEEARLLALARTKLPAAEGLPSPGRPSQPFWGHVETVASDVSALKEALAGDDYVSHSGRSKHQPAARAVGQGQYWIVKAPPPASEGQGAAGGSGPLGPSLTHFVYSLQLPQQPPPQGSPQEQMNIAPRASFILQIKNPQADVTAPPSSLPQSEPFPEYLLQRMAQRRFVPADPPDFLDYQGCQFLLIARGDDVAQVVGPEAAGGIAHNGWHLNQDDLDILALLQDSRKDHDALVKPLFEEAWA